MNKHSKELVAFAEYNGCKIRDNSTSEEIPVSVLLDNGQGEKNYRTTVCIEDNWSKYESNSLYIDESEIGEKLGYQSFSMAFGTIFSFKNGILKFNANGYEVTIIPR